MKLGIASDSLGASTLAEAFKCASQVGAEGVEVHYSSAKDIRALGRKKHPDELKALAQEHGLAVPSLALIGLCRQPSLIGDPKTIADSQKSILNAVTVAAAVAAETVVVPFYGKNALEVEGELTRAADALMELVESAEDAGVVLAVESTLNFNQMRFLLNYLGNSGGVKICYDLGAALVRRLDVASGIRNLGPEAIAGVHLKDVRITEGKPPDFDVVLGEGSMDFRAVIGALRAVHYDGWIMLETPPGDDPLTSAKKNLAFVQQLLSANAAT